MRGKDQQQNHIFSYLATKCAGTAVCNETGHAMGSQLGSETEVSSVADQAWHPEVWLSCVSAWQRHIIGPDRRSKWRSGRIASDTPNRKQQWGTRTLSADERTTADDLGRILHVTARNEEKQGPAPRVLTLLIQ
jgi:hypothetical protein